MAGKVFRKARAASQAQGLVVDYLYATSTHEDGRVWDTLVFEDGTHFELPSEDRYDVGFDIDDVTPISCRKQVVNGSTVYDIRQGVVDFAAEDGAAF